MGYTKRPGTSITDFWPDDDQNTLYIDTSDGQFNLQEILEKIGTKWPGCDLENITITTEHIHTSCIYYDLHDEGDWTTFFVARHR